MSSTKEMINILFPKTDEIDISYAANIIDIKCQNFGLNTPLRVAHFLAQVREEVGDEFKSVFENLNYSEEALPKLFKSFRENDYANLYGRNSEHPANIKMIANIAYANRMGNGDIESEDGYKYRGAGALQITGKGNYIEVQKRIDKYVIGKSIDIINSDDIHTLKGSILAGAGYWIWKDIYKDADLGIEDYAIDNVTARINKHTDSYIKRRKHFNKIKHLI